MYSTPIAGRAATDPDGRSLATPAHALTWSELAANTDAAARALAALDLGPHRRVAIMAHNSVDTVLAYLAALHAGLSIVPVSFHLTAREVAYILGDSGAAAVLCDADSRAAATEAGQLSSGVPVFSWDDDRTPG